MRDFSEKTYPKKEPPQNIISIMVTHGCAFESISEYWDGEEGDFEDYCAISSGVRVGFGKW